MLDTILEMKHRDPFQVFRIILTSGHTFDVTNPDLLAIGKSEMTLYYPRSDKFAVLRLNQVAAVEATQERAA